MNERQSKTPWTAWPWRVEEDWTAEIIGADGSLIGKIVYPQKICDARLIAAAPEMARLLAKLLTMAEDYLKAAPSHPDNAVLEDVRALLARIGAP